jgi:protein subunit release factor B
MSKKLLFSVTKKDLIRQTFRCGGKGGQNVNKVETGVRFIHEPSGARAESCTARHQHQNEVLAFERLARTAEMQRWLKHQAAKHLGNPVPKTQAELIAEVNAAVDQMMAPQNILIEEINDQG